MTYGSSGAVVLPFGLMTVKVYLFKSTVIMSMIVQVIRCPDKFIPSWQVEVVKVIVID
jgi:hypothetical protein